MQNRLRLLAVIFVISSLALLARLFYWQGPMSSFLAAKAQYQYNSGSEIASHRGNILARDGSWLAASTQAWLLYASPQIITADTRVIANTLAPFLVNNKEDTAVLHEEVQRIQNLFGKRDAVWLPIKHRVANDIKETIESLKLEGLGFEEQEMRAYPEGSASAQVLGFVGKDDAGHDRGYFGLEGFYDLSLSGKDGYVQRESDARGAPIFFGESKEIAAVGGIDLLTHIDKKVQMVVEQSLKEGIERYGAVSGSAVVMDPSSGGVLAMAAFPSYDPRAYFDYSNDVFKNPIISDAFEPGSIFKPIIMAAGLDAGAVRPDTVCDICHGPFKVDKYSIETWDQKYYPNSTMVDVIKHSDNVGMVFVGNRLGRERLVDYLLKFGIGQLTNIDLQGEANPKMREKDTWNIVDQATATFGQGIAVTPIQMVRAISVIANGGLLVTPQVVDKFQGDTWEEDIKPLVGERVIGENAAREMTQIMVEAVSQGEAKWAVPRGFKVAGKTGTAQIPVQGHYDEEKTNASFVGFAPIDDPKFVMLITLREPQTSPWASETAAPLWFKIAKELFPYLGIQPEN